MKLNLMAKITSLEIPDVKIIEPAKHGDHRGFFSESYNKKILENLGIKIDFVQDNHSLSQKKYTLRGLHFQTNPYAQDKLIRVTKGSILDIAVDLRNDSKYFGKYVSHVISAEDWNQILVPIGFAHAFITLEDNTEVLYKTSNYYSKDHDGGIKWDDPILNIDFGVEESQIIISDKDIKLPNFNPNFKYF